MEAGIKKFKCATIAEAEMLGTCQAPDVLLAYQPVGPKIDRFINLSDKYPNTRFSCLVDNEATAQDIGSKAKQHGSTIPVFIDLNVGMNRTGILPGEDAIKLIQMIDSLEGIQVIGLHAYDGHIHMADYGERKRECDISFELVEDMNNELKKLGFDLTIVAGGSPTFPIHARRKNIECSPGTFVYWDKGYQQICPEQNFLPAALVISRVISHPQEKRYCLDLGYKSIAAENPLERRVHFVNAPELKFCGHSEEHLMVEVQNGKSLSIGEVLYGMPIHICPTVALYENVLLSEGGEITDKWPVTARVRKLTV
jgi:D-serine deaminase-like pyridoxal phosphate-dependent protein